MAADPGPPVLPDCLQPGLELVFCGTAPSRRSAADGAYYAHPGNTFWRALHEAGFTPRLYQPAEFGKLLELGIGLTDLAKNTSGNDRDLPADAFDVAGLHSRIRLHAPRWLAFTSKTAARTALGHPIQQYGQQVDIIGNSRTWVLPSPSGQARAFWKIQPWKDLAGVIRNTLSPAD